MPTYSVTIGYEWKTFCRRAIEVQAETAEVAAEIALKHADSDPEFWLASDESDGEAGPAEVVEVIEDAA